MQRRRGLVAIACCLIAGVGTTACQPSSRNASGPGPVGPPPARLASSAPLPPELSGSNTPPRRGAPVVPATPHATLPPAGATNPPYPDDYYAAILAAWAAHDTRYLSLLTDRATATRLYGLDAGVASRGQAIDPRWVSIGGRFVGQTSVVSYTNAQGDLIALRTEGRPIARHEWHAGSLQAWDPTTYPHDAIGYVDEFVRAWLTGNVTRMGLLSSPALADRIMSTIVAPGPAYQVTLAPIASPASVTYVEIFDPVTVRAFYLVVPDSVLGAAHAIADCYASCR